MTKRITQKVALVSALIGVSACGTRYAVPEIAPADLVSANALIAQERRAADPRRSPDELAMSFYSVSRQIEPVAEQFCREQNPDRVGGPFCDFNIGIDPDASAPPNAYQSLGEDDRPTLRMTLSFLADTRNDDEIAFVLGHEAGHQISEHLVKQRQQEVAGALIAGALMAGVAALAGAYSGGYYDPYQAQQNEEMIENAMVVGAAVGSHSYSQTYELEADMIGAFIAERAGYDPKLGSRVFARLARGEAEPVDTNAAAFWSTHPSSPERIALVDSVYADIRRQRSAGVTPTPTEKAQ